MGLVSLLFSFKGRINRAQYWLSFMGVGFAGGIIAVMVVAAVTLGLIALPILTGLMGGIATAWRLRRRHRRDHLRFEPDPA